MTTYHRDGANRAAKILIAAGRGAILAETIQNLTDGAYTQGYRRALSSVSRNGMDNGQALAFATLHRYVTSGQVAVVTAPVGDSPGVDKDRAGNSAILGQIPAPFHATLDMEQSTAESDGSIWWDQPIKCDAGQTIQPCGSLRLEVGDSDSSVLLTHLLRFGGFARWPYGENCVSLFVGLPAPIEFARAFQSNLMTRLLAG